MYKNSILILLILLAFALKSQEFNANVTVNSMQISGTDKRVFEDMKENLRIFINERKWTELDIKVSERIECSFLFNIKSVNGDSYQADLTVVYTRPIFNSSYNSPVFNYLDGDVVFEYVEGEALEFNENTFSSNLSSVTSYYLYLILGLDFDTMGSYGGDNYYKTATNILNAAQGVGDVGWSSSFGERNRAALLENLTNSAYVGIRDFLYTFHRLGLDQMHKDKTLAKQKILSSLNSLKQVRDKEPNLFILELLMIGKKDELIDIFKEGTSAEKANAVQILKELDPSHSQDYMTILRG